MRAGPSPASRGRVSSSPRSFDQALAGLPWAGEEELSLTSVSYIIVGRDVELREVLRCVLRNRELGVGGGPPPRQQHRQRDAQQQPFSHPWFLLFCVFR